MWIPLVAVILVLGALVVVPFAVSLRLRRQRAVISEVVDPARLRAADLAGYLAEEMFAVGMRKPLAEPFRDPRYVAALSAEHGDALALDSLLQYTNADAVERFAQYREAATRWHDDVETMPNPPVPAAVLDTARMDGIDALASARRLVQRLEQTGSSVRVQVRRTERIDVLLPAALFPLAVLACVLVVLAGRRTAALATVAERDRRALAMVMEEKSSFVRGLSHDLQNPLGAALGNMELLLDGVVKPEDQRDTLVRIRRLTRRASDTVSALLTLDRSETGHLPVEPTPIDLGALVHAAVDDHSVIAAAKSQRLELDAPAECRALGDVPQVRHIVDNLLSNSSKYTPRGGTIRVRVATRQRGDRRWSTITVSDSGPGIPVEWRERVFEEFVRVPGARDIAPGHGIGLAVSRRVARMLGGDVTVEAPESGPPGSTRLGGAVVTLWLVPLQADSNGTRG